MTLLDLLIAQDSGVPESIIKNDSNLPIEIITPAITTIQTLTENTTGGMIINNFRIGNLHYFIYKKQIENDTYYIIAIFEIASSNNLSNEDKKLKDNLEKIINNKEYQSLEELKEDINNIYKGFREKLREKGKIYLGE